MDKQYARFLVEEVCEGGKIGFVPTYGNTLMGLARHHPIGPGKRLFDCLLAHLNQGLFCVSLTPNRTNLLTTILGAGLSLLR